MPDIYDPSFLPVLKPKGWSDRGRCVTRPLVRGQPDSPLVAYGWDLPDPTELLLYKSVKLENRWFLDDLNRSAIMNLIRRPGRAPWVRRTVGGEASLLVRSGDAHTAAGILIPRLMKKAQEALDCDPIAVAVPDRYHMFACSLSLLVAARLLRRTAEHCARADLEERGPVSPHVFMVSNGRVIGTAARALDSLRSLELAELGYQLPPS